jgi:hypothetical protein
MFIIHMYDYGNRVKEGCTVMTRFQLYRMFPRNAESAVALKKNRNLNKLL